MTMQNFDFVQDATRAHVDKVATEKVERAWPVQSISGVQSTLSERQFAQAGAISRKSLYEAVAGLSNAALGALAGLLYEDIGGRLVNVNPDTWRIAIPLPWGRLGRSRYNLRSTEAATLRSIMLSLSENTGGGHINWLFFDAHLRHWCLNLADYPTIDHAHAYQDRWPITAKVVLYHWERARDKKRGRIVGAR